MSNLVRGQNEYRLVRRISEGGMGAVYEGVQYGAEGFKKQVAIKTIIEDLSTNNEFVEMFIGEAKLVADLVHENIIQVYQLDKIGNTFHIMMEYIDGVDLDAFMRRHESLGREIPIDICAFIASRVCRGLDYAHRKTDAQGNLLGVVHRDVSPRNIMITRLGVVKLGDFGIAKARNILASREGDVLMGKAQYMSPEQAEYKETDPRSDIFSLAIVFYQLLTGVSIFENTDTTVTLQNVARAKFPSITKSNPNVPPELEEILKKALQRKPEKRFQTAGEMGYALEYYMYHDRFGPTNVTLEKYLRELFPENAVPQPLTSDRPKASVEIGPNATLVMTGTTSTTRRK